MAIVGRIQIEELAAGMRDAVDFCDVLLEACLVADEIVAHQLSFLLTTEVACMFALTARAELINHCHERRNGLEQ